MGQIRVRPSKPTAVLGAAFGVMVMIIGLIGLWHSKHVSPWFVVVWIGLSVGAIGFNLWAAFAKKGRIYTLEGDVEHGYVRKPF